MVKWPDLSEQPKHPIRAPQQRADIGLSSELRKPLL